MPKPTVLFVNPHPDDVEFTCANTCKRLLDRGWRVVQILMTTDEYGTKQDEFKGIRIRRIRKREMEEAAKVYGVDDHGQPKIELIWFGEIDGHLRFNLFDANRFDVKLRALAKEPTRVVVEDLDRFLQRVAPLSKFQDARLQRERITWPPVG